eukprot:TRINITY_DN18952_c0_g1_i1.p1 TRINITY_DN18952_c0_g1~~TRINITY_DN18952_c0_g1_i1.p1  ORF type:complete len:287 (-),score=36.68 TRINITY_DN18952_c0_g1_i1:65-925(-)
MVISVFIFFFFNDTATTEIYTLHIVGSVRCVQETGYQRRVHGSPCKGNWGIEDMGYGIYDHYDLGAYNQKGSTETRFGSKTELTNLISACHNTSLGARVDVYADAVLNHTYGEWGLNEESNPAVKAYVFGEAHNGANVAYQTSDIKWVIPNATAGDYYIQVKGYNLPWTSSVTERGYNVNINWTGATETDPGSWESEPNNGNGQTNTYPGSGVTVRAHANAQGDIDEYKITLTTTANIVIKLNAMKETGSGSTWQWVWADQTLGYSHVLCVDTCLLYTSPSPRDQA